jgi:hypothetical protein
VAAAIFLHIMRVQANEYGIRYSVVPLVPENDQNDSTPVIDLSGVWDAAITSDVALVDGAFSYPDRVPQPSGPSTTLTVPGECFLQGMHIDESDTVLLSTRFTVPEDWVGHAIILRLDCVHAAAAVWVNGVRVGQDEGVFLPTAYDLSTVCRPGEWNDLSITARSAGTADEIAKASRYADHPLTGILRQVRLLRLPTMFPAGLMVQASFGETGSAVVDVSGLLIQAAGQAGESPSVTIRATLIDAEGLTVSECRPDVFFGDPNRFTMRFRVDRPECWSTEHPYCYALILRVNDGRNESCFHRRLGMRAVAVQERAVRVNGNVIKLRGVCRHDSHPNAGRAYVPGLCETDIRLFREANVNFLRTSHYPPSENLVDAADEAGVFLEIEAPVCWAFGFTPYDESERRSVPWDELSHREQSLRHESVVSSCLRMARLYGDHPSVLVWSLGNESLWAPPFEAAAQALEAIDGERLRTFNWADYSDDDAPFCQIGVHHYPGPDGLAKFASSTRPMLFDEYCHLNCYNRSELKTDPGVRDLWWTAISNAWDTIQRTPAFLGGSVWAGVDEFFETYDDGSIGYGYWGIINGDRSRKPEHYHLRKAYSPVRLLKHSARFDTARKLLLLPVENRLASRSLSAIEFHWICGEHEGAARIDESNTSSGSELVIDLPTSAFCDGTPVVIEVRTSSGRVLDQETLVFDDAGDHPVERESGTLQGAFPVVSCTAFAIPRHGQKEPLKIGGYQPAILKNEADRLCNDGSFSWTHSTVQQGQFRLGYKWKVSVPFDPWQVGVVVHFDSEPMRLRWMRYAEHSCYPPDHIGRAHGVTDLTGAPDPDSTSTKRNVAWVDFETVAGDLIRIEPQGVAHVRVLQNGGGIALLARAEAGSEQFVEAYFATQALISGDTVSGEFVVTVSPGTLHTGELQ